MGCEYVNKQFRIKSPTDCKTIVLKSDDDIIKLALTLSNDMINGYEEKTIDRIIAADCTLFSRSEKQQIKRKSMDKISGRKKEYRSSAFCGLCKYIKNEDFIDIDGYILFRMADYGKYIESCVDIALDEYLYETELENVTEMLSYYAQLQPANTELAILLYDEEKYIIADEYGEVFLSLAKYDNIIIDILLALSPDKIAIINAGEFENHALIEMIANVFKDKIMFIKYNNR